MCSNTGLWTTLCALCNSREKSSQRGKDIERKSGHLMFTMAGSRQNGLSYRIATQAVAPGLV